MNSNYYDNRRASRTGAPGTASNPAPWAGATVRAKTVQDGLRILARNIARAHLRRQAGSPGRDCPSPPEDGP